jgi:hypothetical protein
MAIVGQKFIVPQSTRRMLIAFASLFRNIVLYKTSKKDILLSETKVPLYISSTEKLTTKLNDPLQVQVVLPAIGINISSMDPAEDRIQQKCNVLASQDGTTEVMSPAPVDYTVDLTAFAKKESELFQLIECIMSKFQKDVRFPFVELQFADGTQIKRDLSIILNSSAIDLREVDVDREEEKMYMVTFTFLVKGFQYCNIITSSSIIKCLDIGFFNEFNEQGSSVRVCAVDGDDTGIELQTGESYQIITDFTC